MALQQIKGELNAVDGVLQRRPSGTTSPTNKNEGSTPAGKVTIKDAQIIVNDGTTNRILIGFGQGLF